MCLCAANNAVLRATLFTPAGEAGPWPVVLIRTPYGKRHDWGQWDLALQGYAVLVQDTRGRFGSDGQFVPVADELNDGAATIAWLCEQPWYNGKLAVTGISYMGFTAWACAGGQESDEVCAVVPVCSQSRVRMAAFLPEGAVALELMVLWLYLVLRLLANAKRPWAFLERIASGAAAGLPGKGGLLKPRCET